MSHRQALCKSMIWITLTCLSARAEHTNNARLCCKSLSNKYCDKQIDANRLHFYHDISQGSRLAYTHADASLGLSVRTLQSSQADWMVTSSGGAWQISEHASLQLLVVGTAAPSAELL
jgi:hypothetical protein